MAPCRNCGKRVVVHDLKALGLSELAARAQPLCYCRACYPIADTLQETIYRVIRHEVRWLVEDGWFPRLHTSGPCRFHYQRRVRATAVLYS